MNRVLASRHDYVGDGRDVDVVTEASEATDGWSSWPEETKAKHRARYLAERDGARSENERKKCEDARECLKREARRIDARASGGGTLWDGLDVSSSGGSSTSADDYRGGSGRRSPWLGTFRTLRSERDESYRDRLQRIMGSLPWDSRGVLDGAEDGACSNSRSGARGAHYASDDGDHPSEPRRRLLSAEGMVKADFLEARGWDIRKDGSTGQPVGHPKSPPVDLAAVEAWILARSGGYTLDDFRSCLKPGKPSARMRPIRVRLASIVDEPDAPGRLALAQPLRCDEKTISRLRAANRPTNCPNREDAVSITEYRALDAKLDAIVDMQRRFDETMARVEETVCMVAGRYASDERVTEAVDEFLAGAFAQQEAA